MGHTLQFQLFWIFLKNKKHFHYLGCTPKWDPEAVWPGPSVWAGRPGRRGENEVAGVAARMMGGWAIGRIGWRMDRWADGVRSIRQFAQLSYSWFMLKFGKQFIAHT